MASTKPRYLITNTQERATSDDVNRSVSLQHAALLLLGAAVLQGDSPLYGVVQGLTVTANGADSLVTVNTGLALRSGTAVDSYNSAISWIQQLAATTVDLISYVDGANPKWVAIEITDGSEAEAQVPIQIWNPATQTFDAPALYDKVRRPAPVISVRQGTAAAAPIFPAGGAGVIPLAYVYLAAGALVVGASDIVMCRPMLRGDAGGEVAAVGRDVYGGGVEVAAAGLATVLRNAGGRFAGSRVRWGLTATDGTTAFTLSARSMDGAALPVADDVLYFYACPPPYPSGYDSNLAPREHRPGATALTRYQGMVPAADMTNAVLVVSTVEPQVGTQFGSPVAGNFSVECAPFSATGTPVTIDRATAMYLGATSWDFSATGQLVQDVRGAWVMLENPTSLDVIAATAGTYSLWDSSAAAVATFDLMLLPVTALKIRSLIDLRDNAQNSGSAVQVRVTDETLGVFAGLFGFQFGISNDAAVAGNVDLRLSHEFYVERGTGNITINAVTSDASDRVRFYQDAYEDNVLAMR